MKLLIEVGEPDSQMNLIAKDAVKEMRGLMGDRWTEERYAAFHQRCIERMLLARIGYEAPSEGNPES